MTRSGTVGRQVVPGPRVPRLKLHARKRRRLEAIVRSRRASSGRVQRARIVLLAARGASNAAIARECQCTENTVRKWRTRFEARPKRRTLKDDMRTGRPPTIPMFVRLELVKLACDRPAKCKLPFREVWTLDALRVALRQVTGFVVSKTEIRTPCMRRRPSAGSGSSACSSAWSSAT